MISVCVSHDQASHMISQGCAHARVRIGDVINFGTPGRSEEYNCQMHELMFRADVSS